MKLRRRHLTLLEVMISFTLIVLCLYPLLSPHLVYYQTQRKLANSMRTHLAVGNWYASLYEELLEKKRSWDSLPTQEPEDIEHLPEKASYLVEVIDEKKGKNGDVYFLRITIQTQNSGEFNCYFVAKRKIEDNQEEISDPA